MLLNLYRQRLSLIRCNNSLLFIECADYQADCSNGERKREQILQLVTTWVLTNQSRTQRTVRSPEWWVQSSEPGKQITESLAIAVAVWVCSQVLLHLVNKYPQFKSSHPWVSTSFYQDSRSFHRCLNACRLALLLVSCIVKCWFTLKHLPDSGELGKDVTLVSAASRGEGTAFVSCSWKGFSACYSTTYWSSTFLALREPGVLCTFSSSSNSSFSVKSEPMT